MGCIFCKYDFCKYQSITESNTPEIRFKPNHKIDILKEDKSSSLLFKYYEETKHIDDDIKPQINEFYKKRKPYKECFPYGIDILK